VMGWGLCEGRTLARGGWVSKTEVCRAVAARCMRLDRGGHGERSARAVSMRSWTAAASVARR